MRERGSFRLLTGVAPPQGGSFEVLRQDARVTYELVVCETVSRAENVRRLG
jgi:hypothetical protein